jgi:hypothetical protein
MQKQKWASGASALVMDLHAAHRDESFLDMYAFLCHCRGCLLGCERVGRSAMAKLSILKIYVTGVLKQIPKILVNSVFCQHHPLYGLIFSEVCGSAKSGLVEPGQYRT